MIPVSQIKTVKEPTLVEFNEKELIGIDFTLICPVIVIIYMRLLIY